MLKDAAVKLAGLHEAEAKEPRSVVPIQDARGGGPRA